MNNKDKSKMQREVLLDKGKTYELLEYVCDCVFGDDTDKDSNSSQEMKEEFKDKVMRLGKLNIDLVFQYAESEIETIFLNALYLSYMRLTSHFIFFNPPIKDVPNHIREKRKMTKKFLKYYEPMEKSSNKGMRDFAEFLYKTGKIGKEEKDWLDMNSIMHEIFNIFNSYEIIIQGGFPNIKNTSNSIRVDMVVWVPNNENINIVIECDGYEYHKDKIAFINDKKRDRQLKDIGFDVRRYSGSEIFVDPIETSMELIKYLEKIDLKNN